MAACPQDQGQADLTRDHYQDLLDRFILPTFEGGGTHVNLSGVVLARHAPNKANAMKLIEWLVGPTAQQMYADLNYEYPVLAGVPVNATIKGWKDVIADNKLGIAAAKKRDPLIDEALETERLQISLQTNILTPYVKANGMGGCQVRNDLETLHRNCPPR